MLVVGRRADQVGQPRRSSRARSSTETAPGSTSRTGAERAGDRPPQVGLAVGHARARSRTVPSLLLDVAVRAPPRPAGSCRRRPRPRRRPGRPAAGSDRQPHGRRRAGPARAVAPDERRPACAAGAGRAGRAARAPARPPTGSSRPRTSNSPDATRSGWRRSVAACVAGPTSTPPGGAAVCRRDGGVHDVAHRGVVAAGPERADQHLAGVDADAHADAGRSSESADELGERAPASAARPARPARRRPRGRPGRRTGRRWRRRGSCRPARRRPSMSATSRWKQPSTRRFTCSGSRRSASAGEADEVGEQHGDDAALLRRWLPPARGRRTGRTGRPPGPATRTTGRRTSESPSVRQSTRRSDGGSDGTVAARDVARSPAAPRRDDVDDMTESSTDP